MDWERYWERLQPLRTGRVGINPWREMEEVWKWGSLVGLCTKGAVWLEKKPPLLTCVYKDDVEEGVVTLIKY